MTINVGVLTAGGDTPGLNAALRGLGKSAAYIYDLQGKRIEYSHTAKND